MALSKLSVSVLLDDIPSLIDMKPTQELSSLLLALLPSKLDVPVAIKVKYEYSIRDEKLKWPNVARNKDIPPELLINDVKIRASSTTPRRNCIICNSFPFPFKIRRKRKMEDFELCNS